MLHVVNDVYTLWNDIDLDIGVCRDDTVSMSYDVYIDMGVSRDDPEFMSYDVVNDLSNVYNDIVSPWDDILIDIGTGRHLHSMSDDVYNDMPNVYDRRRSNRHRTTSTTLRALTKKNCPRRVFSYTLKS